MDLFSDCILISLPKLLFYDFPLHFMFLIQMLFQQSSTLLFELNRWTETNKATVQLQQTEELAHKTVNSSMSSKYQSNKVAKWPLSHDLDSTEQSRNELGYQLWLSWPAVMTCCTTTLLTEWEQIPTDTLFISENHPKQWLLLGKQH